jgi:branched-chain amino acid transport system ATP-binding protein
MGLRMAPDVLLLDEPSLGLAPVLVHQIMDVVDDVRKEFGLGVVVVEQNMQELLVRARDLMVMSRGAIVWTGKPGDLKDTRDLWKFF